MVTAGIYLICRLSMVFVLSPAAMIVVAFTGALTALLAATIALVQNDIKKVLAYSTVSQLGFMFLGVGVGAFTAGFFHVFTHAFFKACLFLGAGSVIHAMHGASTTTTLAGHPEHGRPASAHADHVLHVRSRRPSAIIGFPLTSGFFSKDEILARTPHRRARRMKGAGCAAAVAVAVVGAVGPLGHRHPHRHAHGLLHVPRRLPDVLR